MNNYLSSENEKLCCGCLSCVYSCPTQALTIQERFDMFSYPQVDASKCVECGLCSKVCPVESYDKNEIISTYALKHKDSQIRKASSSGGAFTAISDYFLDNGYYVFGSVFDEQYRAVHMGSKQEKLRDKMRISKYVESSLKGVYPEVKELLDNGEKVFFTGTPCQVAGLKKYLKKEYEMLFTMDVVCNGVLSPKMLADYLSLCTNNSNIEYFACRDKYEHTWADSQTVSLKSEEVNLKYLGAFYKFFSRSYSVRPSCTACKFTNKYRASDITVGDFWSLKFTNKEFVDDLGVSLVCANSQRGKDLIDSLGGSCDIIKTDKQKTVAGCDRLNYCQQGNSNNKMFWNYYKRHSARKTFEIYAGDSVVSKLMRKPFELITKNK